MIEVMSSAYREMQRELHARPEGYGTKGDKWAPAVAALVTRFGATSVLDYGCGKGALVRALKPLLAGDIRLSEYDPAITGKDHWPAMADLVVATDVLEHVEPDRLMRVLYSLRGGLARHAVFAVISTRLAQRTLADGRNAHLIVESEEWWMETLTVAGFTVEPGPKSPHPKPSRELSVVLT